MIRGPWKARDGGARWQVPPPDAAPQPQLAAPWPAPPWPAPPPRPAAAPQPPAPPRRSGTAPQPPAPPPGTFIGAVLPVCGVEVLIVVVHPHVLADLHEANLYVVAFHERFRRTIVLVAQDAHGRPRFYGPTEIARVLSALPFEVLPWRWLLYRTQPPPTWRLPIPKDTHDADSLSSSGRDLRSDHQPVATRMLRGQRGQPASK